MIDLKRIRLLCKNNGKTLKEMSEDTGIAQSAITMSMRRNSTTLETLEKIAQYFGVSVGYFFCEEDIFEPMRMEFRKFDHDIKTAFHTISASMQFYVPEYKDERDLDKFFAATDKYTPEVIKLFEHFFKSLTESTVCKFLLQMPPENIIRLKETGIISKDAAEIVFLLMKPEKFKDKKIKLPKTKEPSFWEKMNKGFMKYWNDQLDTKKTS